MNVRSKTLLHVEVIYVYLLNWIYIKLATIDSQPLYKVYRKNY